MLGRTTVKSMLTTLLMSGLLCASWAAYAAKAKPAATKSSARAVVTVTPMGDAVLGREKAEAERCMECHGVDGQGAGHANGPEGKFAKLAGQSADYILKQIQDFRSGARKHDQMQIMARSVSDEDVRDIAAYFAAQPPMRGDGAAVDSVGQALFENGDASRGVLACTSCHGPQGKGMPGNLLVPVIGGQEWRYLDKQLRDWRSGERRNSADAVMNQTSRPLTDAEIEALTNYLSGV